MINIDIVADEELQKVVNVFISGMLPHANYNPDNFPSILSNTLSYVHLEEFSMEYYVLLKALDELNKIKVTSENFKPRLTKDRFLSILEVSADDLVSDKSVRLREYLDSVGLQSNLDIQANREAGMQKLYSRAEKLYDTCFSLAQPSESVENSMPEYRAAFIAHVGIQSIQTQNAIIMGSIRLGRRVYSGFDDWLEYSNYVNSEINTRLRDVSNNRSLFVVDSLTKVAEMSDDLSKTFIPICPWGIPELDGDGITAGTPILRHRLVTVVGSVNVGKTMFCIDSAVNVVLAGRKVLYMYGEGAREQVWGKLLINYIYKKFGKFVTLPMLAAESEQPELIRRIIAMAKTELYESGAIALREAYSYDTMYQDMCDDYKRYAFDLAVIDHSLALNTSGKTATENVHNLAVDARNFKRLYPVCILVASHPSSAAKECLAKDAPIPGEIAATRESSTLEAESDELFILRDNQTLFKQGLIKLENKKRRDAPRLQEQVILGKMFDVCHFEYDPKNQASDKIDNLNSEEALRNIDNLYGSDYEDDDVYGL